MGRKARDRWYTEKDWPSKLCKREGSGNFYARFDYPKDVKAFVTGAKQTRVSLQTADYKEAKRLLVLASAKFEEACNDLRVKNGAEAIALRARAVFLQEAYTEAHWTKGYKSLAELQNAAPNAAMLTIDAFQRKAEALLGVDVTFAYMVAGEPEVETLKLPTHTLPAISAVIQSLLKQDIQDLQPGAAAVEGKTLEDLLEMRKPDLKPRTVLEMGTAIARFNAVNGSKPIASITKDDGTKFIFSLEGALATRQKQLSCLKSLLNFAVDAGLLDINPILALKATGGTQSIDREYFSPEDLRRLFAGEPNGSVRWWLMRLGLYTGMRLNELAKLSKDDIFNVAESWFIDVRGKLKTKASRRIIPIHKQLVEDGFLSFVPAEGRLFPSIQAAEGRQESAAFSQWFGRHKRSVGIDSDTKVFHSFRHTFKAACRSASIAEDIHDALTGHTNASVGRTYGKVIGRRDEVGFLMRLKRDIDRISFEIA